MGAEVTKQDYDEEIQEERQPSVVGGTAIPRANILVDPAFGHGASSYQIPHAMPLEGRLKANSPLASADYFSQPPRSTEQDATGCLRKQTSSLSNEYPKPFNKDLLIAILDHQRLDKAADRQRQVERSLKSGPQAVGSGPVVNGGRQQDAGQLVPVDSRAKRGRDDGEEGVENHKRFKSSMNTPDTAQARIHQVSRNPNLNPTSNIAINYDAIQIPGAPRIPAAPLPINHNTYRQMGTGFGHGGSNSDPSWATNAPRIDNASSGPPPSYEEATLGHIDPRPQPSIDQEIARNRARRYQPPYPFPNNIAELQVHMDAISRYMERGSAIQHELHLRMLEAARWRGPRVAGPRY